MAPFGRNFLKTRLKSRTRDAEPVVAGKEIQVSVCEEEKVVCGVTKHTTCADMVQALLEDHRASAAATAPEGRRLPEDHRASGAAPEARRSLLHGDPKDFCLLERWRGFERALPPLTRILRLWNAWGDQKPFIQFLLVKTSDFVAQPLLLHAGRNNKAASASNKAAGTTRPKLRWEQQQQQQQQFSQSLPVERQKRMVKKAFRKLEKLHKSTSSSSTSSSPSSPPGGAGAGTTEDIDRMVQLILAQDHSIRGQIQRMRELDGDIQRFEVTTEATRRPLQPVLEEEDSEEQLEEQMLRHKELIMELSLDIDAELRRVHFDADGQEECVGATSRLSPSDDSALYAVAEAELERLQVELRRGLSAGVSLRAQTSALDEELACYEAALLSRDQECWRLEVQLHALQTQQQPDEVEKNLSSPVAPNKGPAAVQIGGGLSSQTVKLKHGLSSPPSADATDTDSDTGISSTHSQDSLSPCLLDYPPPPLDTDV